MYLRGDQRTRRRTCLIRIGHHAAATPCFSFPFHHSGPSLPSDGIECLGERTDREGVLASLIPSRNQWLSEPGHVRSFFDFSSCTRASQEPTGNGQRRCEPFAFDPASLGPFVPFVPPSRRAVAKSHQGTRQTAIPQPEATQSEA